MRIHIGTKPYKCPYCSYSCNTHENIRKHIMKTKKHEGMWIYNCKSCKFGANTVNDFRVHLQLSHPDQYEMSRNIEGLAQLTGLYIKQEDVDKPTEGMKINPIRERRSRDDGNPNKRHRNRKSNLISIDPLYIHEEVVSFEDNEEYNSYRQDQSSDRNWNGATHQMELEQAVKNVEADSHNFDEQRQYISQSATVENVMFLDTSRRAAIQQAMFTTIFDSPINGRSNVP
ncbi:hypothetical protein FSP39_017377 [Pinctada imbricata]|uniref:C2H2-type domain-containing protein n=1 Tax=Pinctada imbricata TaxID=66713 RepID=A0AA88XIM3_PINIB|nr:hypothetical protein FSP39_017377 [Pinctada imbricata]